MKRVTIQDIAEEMGLSRNTVAKAFRNGAIAPDTKKAIIKKAWEMGYQKMDASLLAEVTDPDRELLQGTVFVLFDKSQSSFWTRILAGINDEIRKNGMRMQLHMESQSEIDSEQIVEDMQEDVKGIIFLSVYPIEVVQKIAECGLPMTFFNTPVNAQEYIALGDVYSLESFYAMSQMTDYCIEKKGCRNFAYIGNAEGSRVIQARYLGFLGSCNRHQIELNQNHIFTSPKEGNRFTYKLIEEILKGMFEMPDAIICEDDEIAMNVSLILLQISAELATKVVITGFDGIIPEDFFKQDILTVNVRMEDVGKRLVEALIEKIKDPNRCGAFVTLVTYPNI